ncbi:hypothetical protein CVT25_007700, partial [Psilocybe cyanescens]
PVSHAINSINPLLRCAFSSASVFSLCLIENTSINQIFQNTYLPVINDVINKHIRNQLPIFLLDLESMQLIRRSAVTMLLKDKIEEYETECMSMAIQKEDLHSSTEEWIKAETRYAILSHRWLSNGELAFKDVSKFADHRDTFRELVNFVSPSGGKHIMNEVTGLAMNNANNTKDNPVQLKDDMRRVYKILFPANQNQPLLPSFMKLIIFFWISTQYSSRFVWFDTGCINKSSSVELEESIRSIFDWYSNSKICIVHLADTTDVLSLHEDQWFTRGWTLQELLAPKKVKFFGKSWKPITTYSFDDDKNLEGPDSNLHDHLWNHISNITEISRKRIFDFKPGIHQARDALVWLSKRRTTRIEDMAYCLIGLLGIPLSIAYGEGEMAFYRLQVEILQQSPDMGLFVWEGRPAIGNSMLAAGPDCFSSLALQPLVPQMPSGDMDDEDRSYSITNLGLRITLSVYWMPSGKWHMKNDRLGVPEITLDVEKLGCITVPLQTRGDYKFVEIAVLGKVEGQSTKQKHDIAILLGFQDGWWKRISKGHITLSCSIDTHLRKRFIR